MHSIQVRQIDAFLHARQKARTDPLWLCNYICGYQDVSREVHGGVLDNLQPLEGGEDHLDSKGRIIGYTPKQPLYGSGSPEGLRKRLTIFPRGGLKTTIAVHADAIRWIINYPDIRICLFHAILSKAEESLRAVEEHFRLNLIFRHLFPDHVPAASRVRDFGTREQFTTLARRSIGIREPTMTIGSADSVVAGPHYDHIMCDDWVEQENSKTPDRIRQTNRSFGMLRPLFGQPSSWVSLAGTRYDYCLVKDTPILMSDWSHKPIGDIQVGDEVVGWVKEGNNRWLRRSKVLACGKHENRIVNRYHFESGRSVIATPDHLWWKGPHGSGSEYKALGLSKGHRMGKVRRLLIPTSKNLSRAAGWLAGFFDGEGTVQKNPRHPSGIVTICQSMHNPGLVEQARISLRSLGFRFSEHWTKQREHWNDRCIFKINGGWKERYRFITEIAPFRQEKIVATLFAHLETADDELLSIAPEENQDVYWFQSETGNYVADGCCSKNSDLYGLFIEDEAKRKEKGDDPAWQCYVQGCYNKDGSSYWPNRWSVEELQKVRDDPAMDDADFVSQYMCQPSSSMSHPFKNEMISWVPRNVVKAQARFRVMAVDSAQGQFAHSDWSAIVVCAFDRDNRIYAEHINIGHWPQEELVENIFKTYKSFRPRIVRIEEDAYVRGLRPTIERHRHKLGVHPYFDFHKRGPKQSKYERIVVLRPFMLRGDLRFSDGLEHRDEMLKEFFRYPSPSVHDDILDALADIVQCHKDFTAATDASPEDEMWTPDWGPLASVGEQEENTRSSFTTGL